MRGTYEQINSDLQPDGVIGQGQFLHVTMTGNEMIQSRTTDRGKRFMKFTTEGRRFESYAMHFCCLAKLL
jgi:hypothetical protein